MNKIRPTITEVRALYIAAENDAATAEKGLQWAKRLSEKNAVQQAYEAGFEALQAKFSWNAFYQFSQVKRAMALFGRAIEREPNNVEVRYLRFSVNYFLPLLMQEKAMLAEDKAFLLKAFPFTDQAPEVRKQIEKFMTEKANLTFDLPS